MAVIVDDAAVRGRAGPHGDAVVKLDGTEVLVNLGHRVIETDGNAASADDEVLALSQAADGSYFIGQVIRAVGYVIEGDGCTVLFQ